MRKIIKENFWADIIITIILISIFSPINTFLTSLDLSATDLNNMLITVSMISVIACFGNFTFTYEKINQNNPLHRYLAHFVTGSFMLVLGITLIFLDILLSFIIGHFLLIDISFIILYLANIGFDFWDILRGTIGSPK